ncbi:hypothetical protein GCK32_007918 [Trichostrongylus colubriformis]|uniref:MULE transposase domain-containing protein n=1 Tax=Trichostrongylus colubriformis TaxID=6319 RepID=A0AAN8FVM0_TRICO
MRKGYAYAQPLLAPESRPSKDSRGSRANSRTNPQGKRINSEHSMDYIIGRLRKEDPTRSSKLSFVVKQDLHNIVTKYNMAPGWKHNDELTSMRIRFEENSPDDGLRFLHFPEDPSGKGLLLVSLDDTFHTTRYNLRLATLIASDNRDQGLPGAFLIRGTITTVDVQRLFLEIKALIPNFSPATIVTDEAP